MTWSLVGSDTFAMGTEVQVGLAVSSHDAARLATVTFDNVTVTPVGAPPPNVPPSVALTTPVSRRDLHRTGDDRAGGNGVRFDGTISRVDFYSGSTLARLRTPPHPSQWA